MDQFDIHDMHSASTETAARLDKIFRRISFIALLALIFLAGSLLTVSNIFPGPQVARAFEGGKALYTKLAQYRNIYHPDLWYPERRKDMGVTVKNPERMQEGVTLYTSGSEPTAFLIDADGIVLHSWTKPFSQVWSASAGYVREPQPDSHIYIRSAHVFPNGDLLVLFEGVGDTPYGYGIVKLDRNSEVIWSYLGRAHHQFDIGPDGKIYTLTQEFTEDEIDGFGHLEKPRLEDFLVILSPDGKELKKIRLLTSLADSDYRQMLYTVSDFGLGDPTHANTVEFIDRKAAANFPFGNEGQILLSFRELNAIGVLDPETEEIVWATRGPWLHQHDPDILPSGNILLFDNYANYNRPNGISRVIEFNPSTMEVVWQYAGTAASPLDSYIRSDQQRLPNGNTLITESCGGRIVEVTPSGEIAWEFVNPVRGGPDGNLIPLIAWTQRLGATNFDTDFLDQQSDQSKRGASL